jgi:hypothetical protein
LPPRGRSVEKPRVQRQSRRSAPSSDKAQLEKYRIGGSSLRFVTDPLLHQYQPMGCLMNIVAVRYIAEGLQDLLKTVGSAGERPRRRFHHGTVKLPDDRSRQIQHPAKRHLSPSGSASTRNGRPPCHRYSVRTSDASPPYRDSRQYLVKIEFCHYGITSNSREISGAKYRLGQPPEKFRLVALAAAIRNQRLGGRGRRRANSLSLVGAGAN